MLIAHLHDRLEALLTALQSGNTGEIEAAQGPFSEAVEAAWQGYQQGEITTQVRGQGIPRTMYLYATTELPAAINDPQHWPKIVHELKSMRQLMNAIVAPHEQDD